MSNLLTRDNILQADDLARERVDVPEWGGEVFIRVLSGEEIISIGDKGNLPPAELLSMVLCDESGKPLFTAGDVAALNKKNGLVLTRLVEVAARVNGLTAESVKDIEKN